MSVALTVNNDPPSTDQGFSNLQNYSRLAWLNSKYAIDDEVVTPYLPLKLASTADAAAAGFSVELLNRRVTIGANGLPAAVTVTRPASAHGVIAARKIELLAQPVTLELLRAGAAIPATVRTPAKVWRQTPATVDWSSVFVAGPAQITVNGTLHFDGYMDFAATFASATASDTFEVDDIRLRVEWKPQPKDRLFFMGLGVLGHAMPANDSLAWKWSLQYENVRADTVSICMIRALIRRPSR